MPDDAYTELRKCQSVQDYRENTEVQHHIRMVAAPAHLPEDDVIDGWLAVVGDCVTDN